MPVDDRHQSWLQGHVVDWENAGLISANQGDAILHFEHADEPVAPQRLTVVAEVASYLGSVIAFAGGAAIIGPNWGDLGLAGQGAVALAIAVIGFAVGSWLMRQGETGTERLGGFLWVIGTGGVALGMAGVVNEIDPADAAWFPLTIGVAVLAIGAGLWRNLERPLQLLTAGGGVLLTGGGLSALIDLSIWVAAPTLWLLSSAFGILAASGRVRPRLVALAVAAAGLMVGSFLLMEESEHIGAIAAVGSAAVVVAFALYDRSWPLVALGLIAFFMAISSLMATVLESVASRLIAVVLGLVVVAAVAVRAQRMGNGAAPHRSDGTPTSVS